MSPSVNDQFLSHLMLVLTTYEMEPTPTPLPTYDGPRDWQTDAIQRGLALLARRMHTAEDTLASIRANDSDSAGPDSTQGHSGGDTPITRTSTSMDDAPVTTTQAAEYPCPTCGHRETSGLTISPSPSPLVVPPGPLNVGASESNMSAVEELKLLKAQVQDVARVCKAVARGDLSKQIEVDANGEILDLKTTVNGMVLQLRTLATEMARVTLEVGSQGKLGGMAEVPLVEGVWRELTDNINEMCSNLTNQVRSIAVVTTAVAQGNLTQKIKIPMEGEMAALKDTVNKMVDQLSGLANEVTRVALEVGTEGILGGQAIVADVQGTWADLMRNINNMTTNLTNQVRSIADVTKAVAQGDLTKKVNVDARGEMLYFKMTVNSMVKAASLA